MSQTPEQVWAAARVDNEAAKPSVLAARLGLTPQAISLWKRVPAERVLDVEQATGISRHVLRPDVFGPAPAPSTHPQEAA